MYLQARAAGKLITIPKKMLPMQLQLFKQLLLKGVNPLRPAAATALADAPSSGILTVPGIRWVLPGSCLYISSASLPPPLKSLRTAESLLFT